MRAKLSTVAMLLTLTLLPSVAGAGTILSAASAGWEYTFTDPTGDASWNTTTGTGSGWLIGGAPFSNVTTATDPTGGDFAYDSGGTLWPVDSTPNPSPDGDDLWVRKTIDFTGYDLSSIKWNIGVDNGFTLYLNGVFVATQNAEGFTFKWEYPNGTFPGALPGVNVLALALEDHGGLTAFDMEVTGNAVPDVTGTLPLLLTGLGMLGIGYKRSR